MRTILAILIMVLATQITRFLPFIIFKNKEPSKKLKLVSKYIPGAVMMSLVLISLPIEFNTIENIKPWLGGVAVVILHLIFNKPLISILGGTSLYCLLNIFI